MQTTADSIMATVILGHPPLALMMVLLVAGCRPSEFVFTDGWYTPEVSVPNAECYDRVWDFNYGSTVFAQEPGVFSLEIWPDNSESFSGTFDFYPCTLDGTNFICGADHAQYTIDILCDGIAASEADLYTSEGNWTSSTSFDITFTYRRAVLWLDGTESTCPDVCTSVWDHSEVLSAAI